MCSSALFAWLVSLHHLSTWLIVTTSSLKSFMWVFLLWIFHTYPSPSFPFPLSPLCPGPHSFKQNRLQLSPVSFFSPPPIHSTTCWEPIFQKLPISYILLAKLPVNEAKKISLHFLNNKVCMYYAYVCMCVYTMHMCACTHTHTPHNQVSNHFCAFLYSLIFMFRQCSLLGFCSPNSGQWSP
jgi:hypothetical protein